MNIPRIVIAGTHSGCGKTTIASGLMQALTDRGLKVQPFKVGPDFIDPTHHTAICGRHSRNLDPFMMGVDGVLRTFSSACKGARSGGDADIAVIEGVMGMFDGLEGTDECSTAHVSRILGSPVALVVDVKGMSRSANALVKGFRAFDPSTRVEGVIYNRVGSPNHRKMIEASAEAPGLGWLPKNESMVIKSRHLGLQMAEETNVRKVQGKVVSEYVDIDAVITIASGAGQLPDLDDGQGNDRTDVAIGVAMDRAFCFYYQDNLDALTAAGARLEFFSPASDRLPDVDGIYLGGGYPELYAADLEASPCRADIRKAADDGMPLYAECGGLMYLAESLVLDREYKMAGILPARAEMTNKLQALGYVKGKAADAGVLPPGMQIAGHEFHYSKTECSADARFAYRLSRGKGIADGRDGLTEHNTVGAYTHAYFSAENAASIVSAAEAYSKK